MGSITREQEYRYQYKTISLQNGFSCGNGGTMNFNLPSNVLEIKNLWAHVRLVFDAAEPVDNRKVYGIGQPTYPPDGAQPKMKVLNLTADANRRIDFSIDLTDVIKELDVVPAAIYQQGFIAIKVHYPNTLVKSAIMELWKMDLVYTTQGIR